MLCSKMFHLSTLLLTLLLEMKIVYSDAVPQNFYGNFPKGFVKLPKQFQQFRAISQTSGKYILKTALPDLSIKNKAQSKTLSL